MSQLYKCKSWYIESDEPGFEKGRAYRADKSDEPVEWEFTLVPFSKGVYRLDVSRTIPIYVEETIRHKRKQYRTYLKHQVGETT